MVGTKGVPVTPLAATSAGATTDIGAGAGAATDVGD